MSVYDRLAHLEISLPRQARPAAAYVPYTRAGNLVFLSGHLAYRADGTPWVGRLGDTVSVADGQAAARAVGITLIATLEEAARAAGTDLDGVRGLQKLVALVQTTPDFTAPHLVANGCSELLNDVFGERGRHARSAFGVTQLPLGVCVEFELVAELDLDTGARA